MTASSSAAVSPDASVAFTRGLPGTIGAYATTRGLPGTEQLSRSDRKLKAPETLEYKATEAPATISTLNFFTLSAWSRVTLGWDETGFLGCTSCR